MEVEVQIKGGNINFDAYEFSKYVSKEAKDLMRKMLTVKVEDRIKVNDAISHPWFDLHIPNP